MKNACAAWLVCAAAGMCRGPLPPEMLQGLCSDCAAAMSIEMCLGRGALERALLMLAGAAPLCMPALCIVCRLTPGCMCGLIRIVAPFLGYQLLPRQYGCRHSCATNGARFALLCL